MTSDCLLAIVFLTDVDVLSHGRKSSLEVGSTGSHALLGRGYGVTDLEGVFLYRRRASCRLFTRFLSNLLDYFHQGFRFSIVLWPVR